MLALSLGIVVLIGFYFAVNPIIDINKIIAFTIFFAPYSNTFVFKTSFADFRILQLFWAFILLMLIIKSALSGSLKLRNINTSIIFVLYIVTIALSACFAQNQKVAVREFLQFTYLLIITYVIMSRAEDYNFFKTCINAFVLSNILFVICSLISYVLGISLIPNITLFQNGSLRIRFDMYQTQNLVESAEEIRRLSGISGLGPIGIANVILVQSFFINYKIRECTGFKRILFCILLLLNFIVMVLTYSRLGMFIFVLLHAYTLIDRNHLKNFFILLLIGLGFGVILLRYPQIFLRLLESFNLEEGSTKYHFVFWIVAIRLGLRNVFTGIGLGGAKYSLEEFLDYFEKFNIYSTSDVDTHNLWLQLWAEQGMLGLIVNNILIFVPLIYLIRWNIRHKSTNRTSIYLYVTNSYLATLLYNLTSNNYYIEIFWMLLALVYASKYHCEKKTTEKEL